MVVSLLRRRPQDVLALSHSHAVPRFSGRLPMFYCRALWRHAKHNLEGAEVFVVALCLWFRQMPLHCEASKPSRPALRRAEPIILRKRVLTSRPCQRRRKKNSRWEGRGKRTGGRGCEVCVELQTKIQAVEKLLERKAYFARAEGQDKENFDEQTRNAAKQSPMAELEPRQENCRQRKWRT